MRRDYVSAALWSGMWSAALVAAALIGDLDNAVRPAAYMAVVAAAGCGSTLTARKLRRQKAGFSARLAWRARVASLQALARAEQNTKRIDTHGDRIGTCESRQRGILKVMELGGAEVDGGEDADTVTQLRLAWDADGGPGQEAG